MFLSIPQGLLKWRRHRFGGCVATAIFSRSAWLFSWPLRRFSGMRWRSVCTTKFPAHPRAVIPFGGVCTGPRAFAPNRGLVGRSSGFFRAAVNRGNNAPFAAFKPVLPWWEWVGLGFWQTRKRTRLVEQTWAAWVWSWFASVRAAAFAAQTWRGSFWIFP